VSDIEKTQRVKQPRLFSLGDPLTERFGSALFRSLPAGPGVYFFHTRTASASSRVVRMRVGFMVMSINVWFTYRLFVVMFAIISKFLLNALPVGESW
jgi:hypothetical protein